jgi:hypothetical protein
MPLHEQDIGAHGLFFFLERFRRHKRKSLEEAVTNRNVK